MDASQHVEQAAARWTFEAIDRERAEVPLTRRETGDWERLVASGQATDHTPSVDPRTIVPIETAVDVSVALAALRADER